jgi:hypothetical protein
MYALSTVTFVNDLAKGKPASLVAGDRDWFYFARSWNPVRREGNISYRYVDGREGTLWVPLARGGTFDCLLRMDRVPRHGSPGAVAPLDLELDINGSWRQDVQVQYDPYKVGQHSLEIWPGVLQPGINRVNLRALPSSDSTASMPQGASAFRFWYLRLAPR